MLSSPDEDVALRDGALPGLAMLLDNAAMQQVLAQHLPQLGITHLQCHYVRYKPETNCLAAFRGRTAGREINLYAKAYPAPHRDRLEQLRDRLVQSGSHADLSEGRLALPGEAVIIQLFPFDREITAMSQLAEPQARDRLLERVLTKNKPSLAAHASQLAVRPLAYKPERRFVAALTSQDEQPVAVLKLHSDASFDRLFKSARRVGAYRPGRLLRVPRRIGYSRRYRSLAMEWLDGRLLADVVQSVEPCSDEVRKVGAALAELHRQKIRKLRNPGVSRMVGGLHELEDSVSHLAPALCDRVRSLTNEATRLLSACTDEPCVVHADFYTKQVVLQEESVGFIDFDEIRLGSRSSDLGNFVAHLEWDVIRGRVQPDRAALVRDAFLLGYAEGGCAPPAPEALAGHTAAGLLRLAPHPFRNREPNWPLQMELLLDRVEAALEPGFYQRVIDDSCNA